MARVRIQVRAWNFVRCKSSEIFFGDTKFSFGCAGSADSSAFPPLVCESLHVPITTWLVKVTTWRGIDTDRRMYVYLFFRTHPSTFLSSTAVRWPFDRCTILAGVVLCMIRTRRTGDSLTMRDFHSWGLRVEVISSSWPSMLDQAHQEWTTAPRAREPYKALGTDLMRAGSTLCLQPSKVQSNDVLTVARYHGRNPNFLGRGEGQHRRKIERWRFPNQYWSSGGEKVCLCPRIRWLSALLTQTAGSFGA